MLTIFSIAKHVASRKRFYDSISRFSVVVKRGLSSNHPADSCKDIRDSGDSKGDGEYWIDPEKSGNPLKVYCDMTTDGGGSCNVL